LAMVLVVGLAGTCLAGAMYRNDSGAVARAVRIEFSEPAEITSMWPSFPQRDPQGPAAVIVLSGGEVAVGGWFSFTWRPDTARLVRIEWFASPPSSARPNLGFSDPKARPEVHGELLNPAFFAHPAYVMQGVSDRDKVFALPLHGVPELAFYPVLGDLPVSSLTWTFEVSHPEGIGTAIEDGMLYIWGHNPEWQGYGEVALHVSAPDGRKSWVAIPVVVFCGDRTLVNPQGKKDYFVPWGVILDINRILSTEEHMRQYNKPDLGLLDRTLRFSRWRPMEFRRDVDLASMWMNELVFPPWGQRTQLALVDVYLAELLGVGTDGVRMWNEYYIESREATDIRALYDLGASAGPTKRDHEEAYIVNEAHRLGMSVMVGVVVSVGSHGGEWTELYSASPRPLGEFLHNLSQLTLERLVFWAQLGVETVDLFPAVSSIHQYRNTAQQASALNQGIEDLAKMARRIYPGPLFHGTHHKPDFFPGQSSLRAPFWDSFDVIGLSGWALDPLADVARPSLAQMVLGWQDLIGQVFQPFQRYHNKPFLMWENGVVAVEGCAVHGLVCPLTDTYDPTKPSVGDMALYYHSHAIAFRQMEGYFGPGWYSYPVSPWYAGGRRETHTSTFRLKAEDVVQQIFLGYTRPQVIVIDGSFKDWEGGYVVIRDPQGDNRGPDDIVGVSYTQDETYLFFMVEYVSPPTDPANLDLLFDITGNRFPDLTLRLSNQHSRDRDWTSGGSLFTEGSATWTAVGVSDNIDSGNRIEIRLAKRFLEPYLRGPLLHVKVAHLSSEWRMHDETQWFPIRVESQ